MRHLLAGYVRVREEKYKRPRSHARLVKRTPPINFSCFLLFSSVFYVLRWCGSFPCSLLTDACEDTKKTKQESLNRRTYSYTNKKKRAFLLLHQKKYAHSLYSHHGHYFNRDAVERDELLSAAKIVLVVEQTNLFEQKIHRLFEC